MTPPPLTTGAGPRRRVLAIEPDPALGRAIARVLRALCDVVVEADPARAVARVAQGERFDVVVCEAELTRGDVLAVLAAVAAATVWRVPRFVFLAGEPVPWLADGGHAIVRKPFNADEICAAVVGGVPA